MFKSHSTFVEIVSAKLVLQLCRINKLQYLDQILRGTRKQKKDERGHQAILSNIRQNVCINGLCGLWLKTLLLVNFVLKILTFDSFIPSNHNIEVCISIVKYVCIIQISVLFEQTKNLIISDRISNLLFMKYFIEYRLSLISWNLFFMVRHYVVIQVIVSEWIWN